MSTAAERKTALCRNLRDVKERVIKGQFIAGECRRTGDFDTDTIDLKKVWMGLNDYNSIEECVIEAHNTLIERFNEVAAAIMLAGRRALTDVDYAADALTSLVSADTAYVIAESYVKNGGDFPSAMDDISDRANDEGNYEVNGIEITDDMYDVMSDVLLFTIRTNCDAPIDKDIPTATIISTLEHVNSELDSKKDGILKSEMHDLFELLRTIDSGIGGSGGSFKSLKNHITRLSVRLWWQRGECPSCSQKTIARIVYKMANLFRVTPSECLTLQWAYDSAVNLDSVVASDIAVDDTLLDASHVVLDQFTKIYDRIRNTYITYPAMILYLGSGMEQYEFREGVLADFSAAIAHMDDVDNMNRTGIDPETFVTQDPVVEQVGNNSFVHTGRRLSTDADRADEPLEQPSLFDDLLDD